MFFLCCTQSAAAGFNVDSELHFGFDYIGGWLQLGKLVQVVVPGTRG